MAGMIVIRGRLSYATPDMQTVFKHMRKKMPPELAQPQLLDPVPTAPLLLSAGVSAYDKDEDIVYRVCKNLSADDGWASSGFWQVRWHIEHADLITFVQSSMVDAAVIEGSHFRRYRPRDEGALKKTALYRQTVRYAADRISRRGTGFKR